MLRRFTLEAKDLLMRDVAQQLQEFYGVLPDGTVRPLAALATRDPARLDCARTLRARLDYLRANLAGPAAKRPAEAVRQLGREQAYTTLNRVAALRLAEERDLIRETVRGGYEAEGFLVFDQLTGGAAIADRFTRYNWFLAAVCAELALDLPAIFDLHAPTALVPPTERALLALLALCQDERLSAHREPGHPTLNLWAQDETLGWLYQYYNAREEIDELRNVPAPRDSRELAVRNQFFTPRYVVQFLTDNTLGRRWLTLSGGRSALRTVCTLLVPEEGETEQAAAPTSEGNAVWPGLPDPRTLRLLDPACGSMHFGLYAFDLLETMYREAWDHAPHLLTDLRDQFGRREFEAQIPGLILAHNIHGVDVDPRAVQVAGLALWLRAQRSFQKLGLAAAERPAIRRANLVLAEPLPADEGLLNELCAPLTDPMQRLVRHLWHQMRLAGETGMLLRIEQEIQRKIEDINADWERSLAATQATLADDAARLRARQLAAASYANPQFRQHFLESAEREVLELMQGWATTHLGAADGYRRLLFADDTARGFAFIELCRQTYDVVVMNPPFGAGTTGAKSYIDGAYPAGKQDLAACFVERMHELLTPTGAIGAISTRTPFFSGNYQGWRQKLLTHHPHLRYFLDLGMGVLDATVETTAYTLTAAEQPVAICYRLTAPAPDVKAEALRAALQTGADRYRIRPSRLRVVTNEPLCYWVDDETLELFEEEDSFDNGDDRLARQGVATADNFRFLRLHWETPNRADFPPFLAGENSIRYFGDSLSVINWREDGKELTHFRDSSGKQLAFIRNPQYYGIPGLTWAYRTARFEPHCVPAGTVFSHTRFVAMLPTTEARLATCALWNAEFFDYLLKLSMERVGHPKFQVGIISHLPHPSLPFALHEWLAAHTQQQHALVSTVFEADETSLYFRLPAAARAGQPLPAALAATLAERRAARAAHLAGLAELNARVYAHFGVDEEAQAHIRSIIHQAGARAEGAIFETTARAQAAALAQWLVGAALGRWDARHLLAPELAPRKEEIFSPLPPVAPGALVTPAGLPATHPAEITSPAWLQARPTLETPPNDVTAACVADGQAATVGGDQVPYPIGNVVWGDVFTLADSATAATDLLPAIRAVLRAGWPATPTAPRAPDDAEQDLADALGASDLATYYGKLGAGGFFGAHSAHYSQNKRVAPLYWPLTTPSGGYTVWLYAPRLTDQTLFRVVSDFVRPRQALAQEEVHRLETVVGASAADGPARRRAHEQLGAARTLADELGALAQEVLRVANLPYRPHPDDGFVVTAAPLHGCFPRGSKWRQATEAAWRALEAGDYDWAHLALTLFPERVREKCVTDRSLAIAHGLEALCEVVPRERRPRAARRLPAASAQLGLVDQAPEVMDEGDEE